MSPQLPDLADRILTEEEGCTRTVIKDSKGYLTVGVGCCVDPAVKGVGLCDAAIQAQLDHDKANALGEAGNIPGFADCNDVQKAAVTSMCFQLGALEWPEFRTAMAAKDYPAARIAALNSKWANETPVRARREAYMLGTGQWLDHGASIPDEEGS